MGKNLVETYRKMRSERLDEMKDEGKSAKEKNAMLKSASEKMDKLDGPGVLALAKKIEMPMKEMDVDPKDDDMSDDDMKAMKEACMKHMKEMDYDSMKKLVKEMDLDDGDGGEVKDVKKLKDMDDVKEEDDVEDGDEDEKEDVAEAVDKDYDDGSEVEKEADSKDKKDHKKNLDSVKGKDVKHEMDTLEPDMTSTHTKDMSGNDHQRPADKEGGEKAPIKLGEELEKILAGEELDEEFKTQATTLFEAAVNERVAAEKKQLQEQFDAKLEEEKEQMVDQIDNYLTYVAEQYVEKNQLAIENGLRIEIMESFVDDLGKLMTHHNIDMPAEKVDMMETLVAKVEELEEALDGHLNRERELKEQIEQNTREKLIEQHCEGLTATEKEKMAELVGELEFVSEETFGKKLEIIRDQYFTEDADTSETEIIVEAEEKPHDKIIDPSVSSYVDAISRTSKKK